MTFQDLPGGYPSRDAHPELCATATGLAAGILLDAVIVRSLLLPALMALFGKWNWWLPDFHKPGRQQVRIGAPDRALTANAGLTAVTELCGRLGVTGALDSAVGPIKQRDRGYGAGELLTVIAAAQLAGEDFLTGLDRQARRRGRPADHPVPGLASRWRLIAVPGRLIRHAGHLILRLPPGYTMLPEVLARLRELPAPA